MGQTGIFEWLRESLGLWNHTTMQKQLTLGKYVNSTYSYENKWPSLDSFSIPCDSFKLGILIFKHLKI